MSHKKAQIGGPAQMIIGLFIALMVIGILQMVSVLTTSKVGSSIDKTSFYDVKYVTNESINITISDSGSNASAIALTGPYDTDYKLANKSDGTKALVAGTDYTFTVGGEKGTETASGTIKLLTKQYNITQLYFSYKYGAATERSETYNTLNNNTFDSYSLGGTAQIVLAVMTIVATIFGVFYLLRGR